MKPLRPHLLSLFLLLTLVAGTLASSATFGSVIDGEVLSARMTTPSSGTWTLKVKLLQGCDGPGNQKTKPGTVVTINHDDKRASYKKGQKLKVQWMFYSAMTPNGAISGTSWKLAD